MSIADRLLFTVAAVVASVPIFAGVVTGGLAAFAWERRKDVAGEPQVPDWSPERGPMVPERQAQAEPDDVAAMLLAAGLRYALVAHLQGYGIAADRAEAAALTWLVELLAAEHRDVARSVLAAVEAAGGGGS